MSLTAGTRLGTYEIKDSLGAGGMGEVYRARDTKLHRDVAIKVLPDLFAGDPDRLGRFEREAHTLAALNHPNNSRPTPSDSCRSSEMSQDRRALRKTALLARERGGITGR